MIFCSDCPINCIFAFTSCTVLSDGNETPASTSSVPVAVATCPKRLAYGEHNLAELFDVGLQPEKIYGAHEIVSMVNGAVVVFQDNETPFNNVWQAGFVRRVRVARRLGVKQPSVLVIGMGSPNFDDTTAVAELSLGEAEWAQLKYVDHVLELSVAFAIVPFTE